MICKHCGKSIRRHYADYTNGSSATLLSQGRRRTAARSPSPRLRSAIIEAGRYAEAAYDPLGAPASRFPYEVPNYARRVERLLACPRTVLPSPQLRPAVSRSFVRSTSVLTTSAPGWTSTQSSCPTTIKLTTSQPEGGWS